MIMLFQSTAWTVSQVRWNSSHFILIINRDWSADNSGLIWAWARRQIANKNHRQIAWLHKYSKILSGSEDKRFFSSDRITSPPILSPPTHFLWLSFGVHLLSFAVICRQAYHTPSLFLSLFLFIYNFFLFACLSGRFSDIDFPVCNYNGNRQMEGWIWCMYCLSCNMKFAKVVWILMLFLRIFSVTGRVSLFPDHECLNRSNSYYFPFLR